MSSSTSRPQPIEIELLIKSINAMARSIYKGIPRLSFAYVAGEWICHCTISTPKGSVDTTANDVQTNGVFLNDALMIMLDEMSNRAMRLFTTVVD